MNKCIIFFHGNDWDGVPSRQRYLMAALSKYIPIIYLDGGVDKKGQVTAFQAQEKVTAVRGLVPLLMALERRGLQKLALGVARWKLSPHVNRFDRVLFWNMENLQRPYRFIHHDSLIFDCIDPCFLTDDEEAVREYDRRESEVLKAAKLVFATAETLLQHCRKQHENAVLLNNACAPEEYAPELLASAPQPKWWPRTDKPIAAYLGSLDWRVALDYMKQAAVENPDTQFVFAGNIIPTLAQAVRELDAMKNVTCPGRISVSDGRYLLAQCDIGLIPFTPSEMNDAINPVKMYAYALLGKPMVGTAMHELSIRPDIAITASSPAQFSKAIGEALSRSRDAECRARLQEFAKNNTWDVRADQAWAVLRDL